LVVFGMGWFFLGGGFRRNGTWNKKLLGDSGGNMASLCHKLEGT
jgi:hypothetical protein